MSIDVIKMGGAAGVSTQALVADVEAQLAAGRRLVLVHGGSDETNRLGQAVGHPPEFVTTASGHTSRRTDRRTLELFMMATALVNRRLVEGLAARGVLALGLSGIDGRLLEARRKPHLRVVDNGRVRILRDEWTGTPTKVNAALLHTLLDAGYTPVIAPVGLGQGGEALNVDGDRAAARVAGALGAQSLTLLTNVPGVLRSFPDESSLVSHVPESELAALMERTEGRMKKKLLGAQEALAAGTQRVMIADGRVEAPLAAAFAGRGTLITAGSGAPSETASEAPSESPAETRPEASR